MSECSFSIASAQICHDMICPLGMSHQVRVLMFTHATMEVCVTAAIVCVRNIYIYIYIEINK